MHKLINDIKFWLLIFSGEDRQIIDKCNADTKRPFYKIGLLVSFIFMGSCISAIVFMVHLFKDNKWLSLPIGIVWAFMITNLYILLLYTVSPITLPTAKKYWKNKIWHIEPIDLNNQSASTFFSGSTIFRMIFISILAIIIAQPLNIMCLSGFAETSLNTHKLEYRMNMIISADSNLIKQEADEKRSLYQTQFNLGKEDSLYWIQSESKIKQDESFLSQSKALLDSLKKYDNFSLAYKSKHKKYLGFSSQLKFLIDNEIQEDINYVNSLNVLAISNSNLKNCITRISENVQSKISSYNSLTALLDENDFYVKRIQILLAENPMAWIITTAICSMFLLPIFWKFKIRQTDFYTKRREIEKQIVNDEYKKLKEEYKDKFEENYKTYNQRTKNLLYPLLEKLKFINSAKYKVISKEIEELLVYKPIVKYEYFEDAPFRTIRKKGIKTTSTETDFINKIYS